MQDKAAATAPDINSRIALRVRNLRSGLGITLETLAGKSGVSRSMLSLVERGETSPTAAVLEKIASGLDVPLAALFDDPSAVASPVSRRKDRITWRDPESGYLRTNISPGNFPSRVQIVDVVLPAGARVAYDHPARDASLHHQIWVQEGIIEVTVGRATHRLEPGDCLAARLEDPSAFRNPTRKRAHYIVVVATERARTPG